MIRTVLTTALARAILRKSGWRPGASVKGHESDWIPPGGYPGDYLRRSTVSTGLDPGPNSTQFFKGNGQKYVFHWITPFYLRARRQQYPDNFYTGQLFPVTEPLNYNQIGEAQGFDLPPSKPDYASGISFGEVRTTTPPQLLLQFSGHNPFMGGDQDIPSYDGWYEVDFGVPRETVVDPVLEGSSADEFLVWESIPAGTWYFPYNVDWFVTRRDLTYPADAVRPRMIKMRAAVTGNPQADLICAYSTGGPTGPWSELISVSLSGGIAPNTGWRYFPEGAASTDVWMCLRLRARGGISRLNIGIIEVLMDWEPWREDQLPQEFVPPRGPETFPS